LVKANFPPPSQITRTLLIYAYTHLDVLHDDVDIGGRLDDLVQADDVGVHEKPEDLYLPPHCKMSHFQQSGVAHKGEGKVMCALCSVIHVRAHPCLLTLFIHVHCLDLLSVQNLDGHFVPGQHMLSHLDLERLVRREEIQRTETHAQASNLALAFLLYSLPP